MDTQTINTPEQAEVLAYLCSKEIAVYRDKQYAWNIIHVPTGEVIDSHITTREHAIRTATKIITTLGKFLQNYK